MPRTLVQAVIDYERQSAVRGSSFNSIFMSCTLTQIDTVTSARRRLIDADKARRRVMRIGPTLRKVFVLSDKTCLEIFRRYEPGSNEVPAVATRKLHLP